MKWKNLIKVAFKSIVKNKMRTLLTMLGIIIGVGAVIVMVAIGKGAEQGPEPDRQHGHQPDHGLPRFHAAARRAHGTGPGGHAHPRRRG